MSGMTMACEKCGVEHSTQQNPCPSCAYDRFLELEIGAFLEPAIARARKFLLAIGILYIVGAGIDYYRFRSELERLLGPVADSIPLPSEFKIVLITQAVIGVVHIGLWMWAKIQPFLATLAALVLFVVSSVVVAVTLDASQLFSLWRALFLIVLFLAVSAAYKARQMRLQRDGGNSELPPASLL